MTTAFATTTAPVLALEQVHKRFRATQALHDVTLTVPEASFTVLLGPAGAGKTTTLRVIAGLDQPDAGRVLLAGQDMRGWEPKDRNVAMIFDNLALYPNKTGFQNLASPLRIRGEKSEAIREKVEAMAKTLKVLHILDRLPRTMSGGERQRIALGRALIRTPRLFLLDEPLSSLDAMLRIELRAELKRLQRECGATFLMATPDYTEALAIADTVALLREGRVVQLAGPQTLYDLPADREVARFVGAPQINCLPARYVPGQGRVEAAGGSIRAPRAFVEAFGEAETAFELGLRPEHLAPADPDRAALRAEVIDVEPLGLKSVLTVRNEDAELRVVVETATLPRLGLAVGASLGVTVTNPDALLAFDLQSGRRIAPVQAMAAP
ncbi:ABC transporter ATP-binding protein [Megalodesulfovibrio gigas]|uniref:Putative ABC transporter related protein n=1 Tax=Megalodesulfovibrio gigas (strain ATCC 19364 / DSM 1382 / NCIMB 9332 / VKM B-1759) TaxID=1121448 RepID=T2GB52_MEGG1|nr:ABC transporter ATP-binding protein [Megalodesulfovibrio gigas]AGW13117.1 putative ABC transporter related protein [Megalodesulfovibrio gigas DSM 1382 = ATCC 19364]